jgi:hypothetical protein
MAMPDEEKQEKQVLTLVNERENTEAKKESLH